MEQVNDELCRLILASDFETEDLHDVLSHVKIENQFIEAAALRCLHVDRLAVVYELLKSDFLLQPKSELPPLVVGWDDTEMCVRYSYRFYGMISFDRESLVSFFVDLICNCEKPLIIDNIFQRNQVSSVSFSVNEVVEVTFTADDTEMYEGIIYWKKS